MVIKSLLKKDGFWNVVDKMNQAHFTINFCVITRGSDNAQLSVSSWRTGKIHNLGYEGTSEDLLKNNVVAQHFYKKAIRKLQQKIEKGKVYPLADAIKLAIETSPVKFDATVEMHFRLGVDPRQADQNIRATVTLPAGTGKTVRVAVFAPLDLAKAAKAAGADIAEDEEFTKRLDKEQLDFDVLISTPQYMPKLGKYARLLGPKGLMPNPKAGTVTTDIEKAVKEAKAGKIEYRVDKQAIIHVGLGKVSFGADKITENVNAFIESLKAQKPASIKGQYVKSVFISTTMGPSIQVENLYA
jgi:large subunit ribosomal protein L1